MHDYKCWWLYSEKYSCSKSYHFWAKKTVIYVKKLNAEEKIIELFTVITVITFVHFFVYEC